MANRPVFCTKTSSPYFSVESVSFSYNPGFSFSQKQNNITSIHNEFLKMHPGAKILEISSKSDNSLGIQLSAFNLPISIGGTVTTVESAFQSSKVFQNGGPYLDLVIQPSYLAKKDPRLRESGPLKCFFLNGLEFPLEPKTFFYDWLYITAISKCEEYAKKICKYNAFTDIEFNPNKSINCQARSAAIFVSLSIAGKLNTALESPEKFKSIVYGSEIPSENQQMSLF